MSKVEDWTVDDYLPSTADVDWAIVLYHPGLESDLLSSFVIERYGINRTLWVGVAPQSKNPQAFIYNFVENINTRFNGIHKLVINQRDLAARSEAIPSFLSELDFLESNATLKVYNYLKAYGEVDMARLKLFTGINRVNKANMELAYLASENPDYGGNISQYLEDHPELDAATLQQDYPESVNNVKFTSHNSQTQLYNMTDKTSIFRAVYTIIRDGIHPFENLVYNEICQLALKCDKEDILINSWNCQTSMKNIHLRCGACRGCEQFKLGLSIVDKLEGVEFAK